jgi:hypothetical protein
MTFRTNSKCLGLGAAVVLIASALGAEEPAVPVGLQAELASKIVAYDRNYSARAGGRAKVVIVAKSGDPESTKIANLTRAAIGSMPEFGGLPHEEAVVTFSNAKALSEEIGKQHAAVVYLSTGLSPEIPAIADALNGKDVVTIAAVASDVPKGAVLGFDLVSGKPKLLVHLAQAKKQNAAFKAEALKLMKVFE